MSREVGIASPATYEEALAYLFARAAGGYKFGLDRTRELLRVLGEPQRTFPSLHVAGTNGKGSSVAAMEALLRARGLRVGKYTSPHLVDFRERIVVDGRCILPDEVIAFVARWTPTVESLSATFFEATTALAFDHFAREEVDVAIIETGLGGRLDSTNVIDPVVAGVTTIDYDHMEYLGDTLEQIAAEKAGIFKAGRPAVIGEGDAGLRAVLARHARHAKSHPVRVVADESRIADVAVDASGTSFTLTALGDTRRLHTPLAGRYQADNVAFALAMLDAAGDPFRASLADAARALERTRVAGRFQQTGRYIFDVAHNPEGSMVLAETLAELRPAAPVAALFCVLADKDWRRMMRLLAPVVDRFVLTTAPSVPPERAWAVNEAGQFATEAGLSAEIVRDFDDALARVAALGQTVLVTGSFHTVGDAMARLQLSPLCG